jgi:glycerophosphoryl diester phosphodiesterase
MFTRFNQPLIIAHRGASMYAPENTLPAFELAIEQGADGIELDVRLTADGIVVVCHDQSVDRTTQGTGLIAEMSFAALRELDAGVHFDSPYKGVPVPTLEEVFASVGHQTLTFIDLTNYTSLIDPLPEKVALLVKQFDLAGTVLFSSFNPIALRRIHRFLPEVPLGLLALPGGKGSLARGWFGRQLVAYQALHPAARDVYTKMVDELHRLGKRIHPYAADQVDEMQRLFSMGIDGIITDDPLTARQILNTQVK